jgi:hypothetical protein
MPKLQLENMHPRSLNVPARRLYRLVLCVAAAVAAVAILLVPVLLCGSRSGFGRGLSGPPTSANKLRR